MSELTEVPTAATGPRTPEGKARSSQNATKIGLYTARDFILKGEEDEYVEGFNDLMRELDPQTPLEKIFATEIMSANWRLRRCRVIEADLALQPEPDEKTQRSVDRARAQSHVIVRRSMNELRKLQTERTIRARMKLTGITGLAETDRVLRAVNSGVEPSSYENTNPVEQNQQLVERALRRELGFGPGAGHGRKGIPSLPRRRM